MLIEITKIKKATGKKRKSRSCEELEWVLIA